MNPDYLVLFDSCTGEAEMFSDYEEDIDLCEEFEWDDFDGDLEDIPDCDA